MQKKKKNGFVIFVLSLNFILCQNYASLDVRKQNNAR